MSTNPLADAVVGDVLFTRVEELNRGRLVRYAAAGGDFNAIHYNDAVAESVGLPGVIAHGMLTMGMAGSALTDWISQWDPTGPGRVLRYSTRFARPIIVPPLEDVAVSITGTLGAIDQVSEAGEPCVRIDLKVEAAGVMVLMKAQALVRV